LIISQIGATAGWAMLAFAPTLAWVFVARIVEGISGGNISVTQSYVADRVEPAQRSRAFAYVGAAFSAGFVLGPVAGGILLDRFSYREPFLLAASLQVITLLVTIFFLPEQIVAKSERGSSVSFGEIVRSLRDPSLAPVLVQKLAYSLGLYAWFGVFALVIGRLLGFGPSQTSYFFAVFGATSIVFQLAVVGRLTDRLGARRTSNIGFAAACLFFVLMPFAREPIALFCLQVLLSFGMAVAGPTLAALLTDAAPVASRGSILGVGSSLEAMSGVTMPPLSTAVLQAFGPPWTAALSAAFCALALVLGLVAERRPGAGAPALQAGPPPGGAAGAPQA
jgi:DHA1 family tetracycline resistance protein-like MFS transporter